MSCNLLFRLLVVVGHFPEIAFYELPQVFNRVQRRHVREVEHKNNIVYLTKGGKLL